MTTAMLKKSKTHWFCHNSSYYKGMNTGDENDELEQKKTREFMAKYMANYGAHRKGMTTKEVSDYYTAWSEGLKYEQDLTPGIYNGPSIVADEVAECFKEKREKVRILDVACGTGLIGVELIHLGFKLLDGVDPSRGMIQQCRKKKIYRNLYQEFCCDKTLPIDDSVYDSLVVSGGMGEGHIPCAGLYEMIRVVKPGGYIIIILRREYLRYVAEYVNQLEPLMNRLEQEHKWELLETREVPNYAFNREGILFKCRVKKGVTEEETDVKGDVVKTESANKDLRKDDKVESKIGASGGETMKDTRRQSKSSAKKETFDSKFDSTTESRKSSKKEPKKESRKSKYGSDFTF